MPATSGLLRFELPHGAKAKGENIMTSPSEHLYAGLTWAVFRKTEKLRSALLFLTLAFITMKLGSFIPIPGVNKSEWTDFWTNSPLAQLGGLF